MNPIGKPERATQDRIIALFRDNLDYRYLGDWCDRTTHNARFIALMDQFMPKWQSHRQALNRLPVRHESWGY